MLKVLVLGHYDEPVVLSMLPDRAIGSTRQAPFVDMDTIGIKIGEFRDEPLREICSICWSAGGNAHHIVCCIAGRERELDRRGVGRSGCEVIGPEQRSGRAFGSVIRYRETNVGPIYGA